MNRPFSSKQALADIHETVCKHVRPRTPKVFVQTLGRHHFAYLRAVAEGLPVLESAQRYLGTQHGHEALSAHQQVIDKVRTVARRRAEPAWRLIGLTIKAKAGAVPSGYRPTLEEFIDERGLDGWSEAEVSAMYAEAYPTNPPSPASSAKPASSANDRRTKLRQTQLALLKRLENIAAETPSPLDSVAGWFDGILAKRFVGAGIVTLQDLNGKVAVGGRWWRAIPAIGQAKAHRIEMHLRTLLPRSAPSNRPNFLLPGAAFSHTLGTALNTASGTASKYPAAYLSSLDGLAVDQHSPERSMPARASPLAMISAGSDAQAVESWVATRAGSVATAKSYRKEAQRLLLWLREERLGMALASVTVEDCNAYLAFLQHLPERWISRNRAMPGQVGWAPFRGPLSHSSLKQAMVIVGAFFNFLTASQYLAGNPWALVNTHTGDEREAFVQDTKSLSGAALSEVMQYLSQQPPSPSRARLVFLMVFMTTVGLRSSEVAYSLIAGAGAGIGFGTSTDGATGQANQPRQATQVKAFTRLGAIRKEPEGWTIQVFGKGAKNRVAALPRPAFEALQDYLHARGLGGIESAPPEAPLLARLDDPMEPLGYQALYETVKRLLRRAIAASSLPTNERLRLYDASTHWLRHTFASTAVQKEVPLDVIQAQLGHASIQTTMNRYGRAPLKRKIAEITKAFG